MNKTICQNTKTQVQADDLILELAKEANIKYPVIISEAVKNIINDSLNYPLNDLEKILWDILYSFLEAAKRSKAPKHLVSFKVSINQPSGKSKAFTLYAEICFLSCDVSKPAIHILSSDEL
jgi:hypothetical protein